LRYGAVAASLLKAGGQALQDECTAYVTKHGRLPVGKVAVTRPGLLTNCKRIFHVVGSKYNGKRSEKVHKIISVEIHIFEFCIDDAASCVKVRDKMKADSIAFPALGTGGLDFPRDVAADIIVNSIISYMKSNLATTYIKTVKLVVYMEDTYEAFHNLYT